MLSWIGGPHGETSGDSEYEQRQLTAHKLLMKTLSQQSLSQSPKVEGVWCYDSHRKGTTSGTLCLTGHNMILYADDTTRGEICVQYKNVDSVERRIGIDKGTLVIKCKDLKQYNITIPGVDEASNVAYSVETLSNVLDPRFQFPYFHKTKLEFSEDGWDLFNIDERHAEMNKTSERWRISDVNINFECCRTYGTRIIVPKEIEDDVIRKSAKFRNGGRFPVVSFCHRNNATIIRSSQPLVGSNNRRCKEDEKLLNAMLGPSHKGYILDVRSVQTASQAKVKGGGFEGEHHYSRWRRIHNNLKSYFAQQESLVKIVEACNDKSGNMDRWLSKIESSDWLDYVKRSLDASCLVAQCVDREGWSVLVHGLEGFDSTLTVTSVAQIILDSECRTIRGFLTLIDREWLQGGHPFTERTSHGPYRLRGKLRANTVSLWSMILSPSMFDKYMNPLYRRNNNVIWPSVAPQSLEFWDEYYISDLAPVDPILDRVKILQGRRTELEIMKRQVTQLTEANHAVPNEEPTDSETSTSYNFHSSNGASIQNEAEPQGLINDDNIIQLSSDSVIPASQTESSGCVYVPISSDMSHNKHPDSYSMNSQPDLLEDLLSFVTDDDAAPNDIDTRNLPDLDDLAIDSADSESPDAVSPTPS